MANRYNIITDQVKKFGIQLVFQIFFMTKISLASSEMHEWKSGFNDSDDRFSDQVQKFGVRFAILIFAPENFAGNERNA